MQLVNYLLTFLSWGHNYRTEEKAEQKETLFKQGYKAKQIHPLKQQKRVVASVPNLINAGGSCFLCKLIQAFGR